MKILFVYPDINIDPNYAGYDYLGIAYLSAVLKKEGFGAELLHIKRPISDNEFIDELKRRSPELVAFTSTTNMAVFVERWARAAKRSLGSATIMGGVHATLKPEDSIRIEGIDLVCIGEGEGALVDVSRKIFKKDRDMSGIPNIWSKKNGKIFKNEPRPLIKDLDALPLPDRDIFDLGEMDTYRIFTARGCPYICSYCFNQAYKAVYKKSPEYVRFRSPENIIEELRYAMDKYKKLRYVHFVDDTLPLKKSNFVRLTELYKSNIGLPYIAQARPNLMDEENIRLLKESNCFQLQMGIESGNDYIRNTVLKRNISKRQIEDAFRTARKYNLRTYAYNMVGSPFENKERIMETLKLNASLDIDTTHTSFYYPYPKTELEAICRKEGLIEKDWNLDYFTDSVLKFDRATKEFIFFIRRFFEVLNKVYSRAYKLPPVVRKPAVKLLDAVVTNSFFCMTVNRLRLLYIKIRNSLSARRRQAPFKAR
ncbi:B12-binding domain-containing radical SAM protein [Candidatus Omnitrophota bacterium]